MPRRLTSSAAGALAAVLLAALSAPATAQDVAPGLRGSIGAQETGDRATPLSRTRRRQSDQTDIEASTGTSDGATDPLTSGNLADDPSLTPQPPAPPPPLGGLGDEPTDPAEAVPFAPGLGITTADGLPLDDAPSIDDDLEQRPLLPRGHVLDPYVPIGTRIGSFLLFTEAEIGTILTDNVLGTQLDPQSDAAFEFAPTVRLVSNWSRHYLLAEFDSDWSWYNEFPVEDDRIYSALLRGGLDVTRRTHLELEVEKSQTQAGRNSVSITDIAGVQTNVQEQHITAAADHTFNRLTLKLEGTVAEYDYEDVAGPLDAIIQVGVPFQDVRDYRESELKLRGTYEFSPEFATFVEGVLAEDDYKHPVSISGITRNADGFEVLSGLIFGMPRFTGEIGFGWGQLTSIDESLDPIEGFLLNADLIWRPTPMTMVEFLARTEVDTTTFVDALGAVDRFYELSLQHAFWRYLVLRGFVSYEIADYVESTQVDERLREGLSAEYYFNPNMSVYARYQHTDFFSNDDFGNYTENELRVGMRIRN